MGLTARDVLFRDLTRSTSPRVLRNPRTLCPSPLCGVYGVLRPSPTESGVALGFDKGLPNPGGVLGGGGRFAAAERFRYSRVVQQTLSTAGRSLP